MKNFTFHVRCGISGVFLLLSLLFSMGAMGQTPVKGKIVDAKTGETIIGATIKVKGTKIVTTSDMTGGFTIHAAPGEVLVVSFIGYTTQEATIGDNKLLTISLAAANSNLDEVVVVGYGTQKKATVTGAIETVGSQAFESRSVTNPALALQGETPGLTVTRTSTRPGNEGINFDIRGATSVNGGSPLVVIDGVPASTANSLFTMNPDDIESVTVLKDATAAIYGSRAANGVILVTTKRGKGAIHLDYSANIRMNTLGITTPVPTEQQYATFWIDANAQESVPNYWGWKSLSNLQMMQQGYQGILSTVYWGDIFVGQANRIDELFQTRPSEQQTLSISGADTKTNYRISFGYANNQGNLATAYDGQKQYNLRLNYDYKVTDWFKVQTSVVYQKDQTSGPSSGLGFDLAAEDPPLFPAKNPYGEWYANFGDAGNRNSVAATTDGGRNISENELIRADVKADLEITKNLELEGSASIQSNQYSDLVYNLTVPQYEWDGTLAPSSLNPQSNISTESDNNYYQNYSALLRYNKFFGDNHITVVGGLTAEKNEFKGLNGYRTGITSDGVYALNAAPTAGETNSGSANDWGYLSYLARINYSYKDKYLIELQGRRDGSSYFAPGYQFTSFGSASAGWVASNEDFFKDLHFNALNYLKIRGSYGVTGNNAGLGLYQFLSTIGQGQQIFGSTAANQPTAYLNGITTNDRTWERVKMENIGVDMAFFNSRLTTSFDYFEKQNNGMLINIAYPSVLGGTAPSTNSGVLHTNGWEFQVGWKDKIGNVSYNVGFNLSDANDKLIKMNGASTIAAGENSTVVGYPLNSWFMYQTAGYFQTQAQVDAYYAKYGSTKLGELPSPTDPTVALRPGDVIKVDLDHNGYISAIGANGQAGDVKYMGDAAPHYKFGLNLGASWKNFDISTFFQGVALQHIERTGTLEYPFWAVWTNSNIAFLGKTWTPQDPTAEFPRLTVNPTRAQWDYLHNDFMLQNNRYIRLKSLVIGYTLPKEWFAKLNITKVRVYFSGADLLTFSSIKDGFDPEQSITSQNDTYPFMKTWSFGVNVTF